MDRASQALAKGVPEGVPRSYRALADHSGVPHSTLQHRKAGRRSMEEKAESQLYLWPTEAKAVIEFCLQMSDLGQPVHLKHLRFLAFRATRHRPLESRPSKPPGKNWPKAFEKRYPILQARREKALDWNRHKRNTHEKMIRWFEIIGKVLQDPRVRPENIWNMDETGVMLSMPGSVKVLVGKDEMQGSRGALVKRTTITAIECISADGRFLTPMIIWPATTHRSNWTTFETPGWQYACNESGYTDSKISLEWLKRIFDPQTKDRANGRPRVLICDGLGSHQSLEILEFCFENNIVLCRLPSHTSHKTQPCDVAVFASLKAAYRAQVDRLERGGVNAIGKEHFTSLYSPARIKSFTSRNITHGFAACGLVPFNPQRVLGGIQKPADALTVSTADATPPCLQAELQHTPITPTTPKTSEALVSLQNRIVQQDAHALDEVSKQRLQRHVQKFVNAAQMCLVHGALQQDRIRFLMRINDEAKVRRSTKSEILAKGEGVVISYEHLVAKRAARAAEVQAKADRKGKRGRKRKNTQERTIIEPTTKVARMEGVQVPTGQQIAPVVRMY